MAEGALAPFMKILNGTRPFANAFLSSVGTQFVSNGAFQHPHPTSGANHLLSFAFVENQ